MKPLWVYHSDIEAPCGVDDCKEKFHSNIEWAYHCKKMHKDFFDAHQLHRDLLVEAKQKNEGT